MRVSELRSRVGYLVVALLSLPLAACGESDSGDDAVDPDGSEPEPAPEGGGGEPEPAAPGGDDDPAPAGGGEVSFSGDIVPLFEASCGSTTAGCHARDAYFASAAEGCRGWLALEDVPLGSVAYVNGEAGDATGCEDMPLYERLLTLDAWMCGPPAVEGAQRFAYVTPGSPEESHLFNALGSDPTGGGNCEKSPGEPTTRMPLAPLPALSQDKIDLIESWIRAGAPNN